MPRRATQSALDAPRAKLNLQKATRAAVPTRAEIALWAEAALADLGPEERELTVRLVDEEESAALNQQWRGKRGPTNVLSFALAAAPGVSDCFLGDLVICAPLVAHEAAVQNKPAAAHWAHLVVHGIMHLRGYDHETDPDARIMEAREIDILERLGFENPYFQR